MKDRKNKPSYIMSNTKSNLKANDPGFKPTVEDIFGPVIYSYTRKQAIEDGMLHPVSELWPDACKIFKYPVCISESLMCIIEGNNTEAWLRDLCWMAAKFPVKELSECKRLFRVTLPRTHGTTATKTYELLSVCGPGDDAEPVITICFPHED